MKLNKEHLESIEKAYRAYCKRTGRNGGVLISSSIREVAEHLANYILTTPSIYKAANLIEATPLTDEELEAEAKMLYPEPIHDEEDIDWEDFVMRKRQCESARAAHIKARKMGTGGWVSVKDRLPEENTTIDVVVRNEYGVYRIPDCNYSKYASWDNGAKFKTYMHTDNGMNWVDITNQVIYWQHKPLLPSSPPKTEV